MNDIPSRANSANDGAAMLAKSLGKISVSNGDNLMQQPLLGNAVPSSPIMTSNYNNISHRHDSLQNPLDMNKPQPILISQPR